MINEISKKIGMTNMKLKKLSHDKHEISEKIGMTNMKFTKNRHENMIFFPKWHEAA